MKPVGEPQAERDLGPHDDEPNLLALGKSDKPRHIVGPYGEAGRVRCDPGVAGGAEDTGLGRGRGQCPHERVLPSAGADHEDSAWEFFRFQRTWSFFL